MAKKLKKKQENQYVAWMHDKEPNALYPTGFENAIIGVAQKDARTVFLISQKKVVKILARGMSFEQATEYAEYNIFGAYMGNYNPVYVLNRFPLE